MKDSSLSIICFRLRRGAMVSRCGEFKTKARRIRNAEDVARLSMDIGISGYEKDVKDPILRLLRWGWLCSADESESLGRSQMIGRIVCARR